MMATKEHKEEPLWSTLMQWSFECYDSTHHHLHTDTSLIKGS